MLPREMTSVILTVLCVCLCYQNVLCQFGLFPPREQRRFPSPFGFTQNFFPNPSRITATLNKLLHLEQENPYSNPAYIYPFQNRPITNPNQNPFNVRFPNSGQQNQYPNEQNVPGYPDYNAPDTNPSTDDRNVNGGLTSGQHVGPVFGQPNGGSDGLVSGQQTGPIFGQNNGDNSGSTLISGQQTGSAFTTEAPNFGNSGNLISGQQHGPAFSTEAPNSLDTGGLTSGQHVGPVFGQPNGGSTGLVSGQQTGPVFGQNSGDNSGGTLISGQQTGPAFSTEASNFGNSGNLISGQQNGSPLTSTTPNSIVSGQQHGTVLSTVAPDFSNSGSGQLISGQQNGPVFGNSGNLISGNQNGPVFGPDAPNTGSSGTLISGMHSGPVFSPDANVPTFESRNDFKQGIFRETCNTVGGGIGSCITIVSCPRYVKLLQTARTSPAAVQELRSAQCGFEGNYPKVCCPLPPPPTAPPLPTESPTVPPPVTPSGKSIPSTADFIAAFPEPPVCGVSNASFSRVVGGVDAKLGDFPWMALLGYEGRRGGGSRWLCGGSLISHHHVLTAAHCIHNHEKDLYVVRLGELDLERDDEGATPIDILIKEKIKHEKYNATSYTNDIGLLILERDVDFTDLIRPICIPTRPDLRANLFVDYNPLIAGWGDTEFRGPSASRLQVLQLPVLDNAFCKKAYARYAAQVIDERVMCAGYKKGGKDACQGDSGGPLMQPDYNPETLTTYFYQTGVVSFGRKCAEAGYPGIYTRVTQFIPWLQKNVLGIAD